MSFQNITRGTFGYGLLVGLAASVFAAFLLNLMPLFADALDGSSLTEKEIRQIEKNLGDTSRSIENLSGEYHASVNAVMNFYMKTFLNGKAIIAPPKDTKNPVECTAIGPTMNVSTYCLFLRIDRLYQTYIGSLRTLQDTSLQRLTNILNDRQDASANYYAARTEWIDREYASTQKALDSGLRAYSELLLQYPLHLQYTDTIAHLVKYYDHLVDLRKDVDTLPARFHNVTTAQCE